jgi:hypothetical protein
MELLAMQAEDLRVGEKLGAWGELGEGYAPRIELVPIKKAARLRRPIEQHSWQERLVARGWRRPAS